MPLIKVRNHIVPTIGELHWTAAKYIFDRNNFTVEDKVVLEEGIEAWSKKVDISPQEKKEILRITNALIADERGHWNRAKELFKQHNIDYRKFYQAGLPFIPDPDKVRTYGRG
jgi:hypothetical protein